MSDELKIEQVDRDAAADLWLADQGEPHSPNGLAIAEGFRKGGGEDDEFTKAFARHRVAVTAALKASVDEMAEALGNLIEAADSTEWAAELGYRGYLARKALTAYRNGELDAASTPTGELT